jgi:hypothetical protein
MFLPSSIDVHAHGRVERNAYAQMDIEYQAHTLRVSATIPVIRNWNCYIIVVCSTVAFCFSYAWEVVCRMQSVERQLYLKCSSAPHIVYHYMKILEEMKNSGCNAMLARKII